MTGRTPFSHCHFDGTPLVQVLATEEWPKKCPACGHLQFVNPTPIGVMLQTVTDGNRIGILTPVRGHAPMIGHPGGTGGFQEIRDRGSEHAGAREEWEEIGRALGHEMADEDDLELLHTQATGPFIPGRRQNLVFSVNPNPIHISAYEDFVPDAETRAIEFSWEPRILAFPSHTCALAKYFRRYHGMDVPEHFIRQPRTGDIVNGQEIFNVPYDQPLLDGGIWMVEMQEGAAPTAVTCEGGSWREA